MNRIRAYEYDPVVQRLFAIVNFYMQNAWCLRQKISTMKYFRLSLFTILCSLSLIVCATPEPPSNELILGKSYQDQEFEPDYTPKVPGKTALMMRPLQGQLLKLLDSLHKPEDLTPQLITRVTGLRAIPDADIAGAFYFSKPLENQWKYYLEIDRSSDGNPVLLFFWTYRKYKKGNDWDLTNVCMDMGEIHKAIQALGYKHTNHQFLSNPFNWYERSPSNKHGSSGVVVLSVHYQRENDKNSDT